LYPDVLLLDEVAEAELAVRRRQPDDRLERPRRDWQRTARDVLCGRAGGENGTGWVVGRQPPAISYVRAVGVRSWGERGVIGSAPPAISCDV